jgi:hypothetical protein
MSSDPQMDWPRTMATVVCLWILGATIGAVVAAVTSLEVPRGISIGIVTGAVVSIFLIVAFPSHRQ